MTTVFTVSDIPGEPNKIYSEFILAEQETLRKIRNVIGGGFCFVINIVQVDLNFNHSEIKFTGTVRDFGNLRFIHVEKTNFGSVIHDEIITKYIVEDDLQLLESQISLINVSRPNYVYFNESINLENFRVFFNSRGLTSSVPVEVVSELVKKYFKYRSYICAKKDK